MTLEVTKMYVLEKKHNIQGSENPWNLPDGFMISALLWRKCSLAILVFCKLYKEPQESGFVSLHSC